MDNKDKANIISFITDLILNTITKMSPPVSVKSSNIIASASSLAIKYFNFSITGEEIYNKINQLETGGNAPATHKPQNG